MIHIRDSRVLGRAASILALATLVGAGLEAQPSKWAVAPGDTSPGGFTLPQEAGPFAASSILSEFESIGEESFLALNDDYAAITSPGDVGLLRLFDQDDEKEWLRLEGGLGELSGVFFPATGSSTDRDIQVVDDAELSLRTNGDVMQFVADENGNEELDQFQWHFEGRDLGSLAMFLLGDGNLFVNGTYMTFGPELALRFLRRGPVEAGDLVRLDGGRHDRVEQADGTEGEVVVGVASQRPGLVLGGSILSPQALEEAWGAEVVERFRQELPALLEEALAEQPSLREIDEQMASLDTYLGGRTIKPESEERVRAGYEEARRRHDDQLTLRALQTFSDRNFVSVAVGGRATVKVDASYGQITAGDYLAASPTAGVAMKARNPGSVLGTALESWVAGAGTIEILLQRGWYGGQGGDLTRLATEASDEDRLADLEARVFELVAERSELLDRLAALESQWRRTGPRWARAEGLTASPASQ